MKRKTKSKARFSFKLVQCGFKLWCLCASNTLSCVPQILSCVSISRKEVRMITSPMEGSVGVNACGTATSSHKRAGIEHWASLGCSTWDTTPQYDTRLFLSQEFPWNTDYKLRLGNSVGGVFLCFLDHLFQEWLRSSKFSKGFVFIGVFSFNRKNCCGHCIHFEDWCTLVKVLDYMMIQLKTI